MEKKTSSDSGNRFTSEDFVIIGTIAVTLTGAVALTLLSAAKGFSFPPVIISIFIAIAVAALLYRFLGGITNKNSFGLGALKVTGTAAVLMGVAWWSNSELEKQMNCAEPFDLSTITPSINTWCAFDLQSGQPVTLTISDSVILQKNLSTISDSWKERQLTLTSSQNGNYEISYGTNDKEILLGIISQSDIRESDIIRKAEIEASPFRISKKLYSGEKIDLHQDLPFTVEIGEYMDNYSRVNLKPREIEGNSYQLDILLRDVKTVIIDNRHFIIQVIEVNHQIRKPYIRLSIIELSLS